MTEADRAHAQAIAEQAGLLMTIPAASWGAIFGEYRPSAPEFAGMGKFALYMRCCVDIALCKEPHASSSYRRIADPAQALVAGLCEAELDGDSLLIGLKAVSLSALVSDILDAAQRDPDAFRRAQFAAMLHVHIGGCFLGLARNMLRAGQFEGASYANRHAEHHLAQVQIYADAMRKLNQQPVAAE